MLRHSKEEGGRVNLGVEVKTSHLGLVSPVGESRAERSGLKGEAGLEFAGLQ